MTIRNIISQATLCLIIFISCTAQWYDVDYMPRVVVYKTDIITSNNLCDLNKCLDMKNVTLEGLKLKPGKLGNSLLIPLFEVKDQHGKEIETDLGEFFGCNEIFLVNDCMAEKSCGFSGNVTFEKDGWDIYQCSLYTTNLFVFMNSYLRRLYVYLHLTIRETTTINMDGEKIKFGEIEANFFIVQITKNTNISSLAYTSKHNPKSEKWFLEFPNDFTTINFFIKCTGGLLSISDNNKKNKYCTIKPQEIDKRENVFKKNFVEENNEVGTEEKHLKQKHVLSTNLKQENESKKTYIDKLENTITHIQKDRFSNKTNMKTDSDDVSKNRELGYIREELVFIKEQQKYTIEELSLLKDVLKITLEKLVAIEQNVKNQKKSKKTGDNTLDKSQKKEGNSSGRFNYCTII
ncbi:hypothetical protein CDIK_2313 [Cucumispora dikerogammari]|nr:hypothetical protein CDIK_2313 [Cucumispora dikerogammari]